MSETILEIVEHPRGRYCKEQESVTLRFGIRYQNTAYSHTLKLWKKSLPTANAEELKDYPLPAGEGELYESISLSADKDSAGAYYVGVERDGASAVDRNGRVREDVDDDEPWTALESWCGLIRLKYPRFVKGTPSFDADHVDFNYGTKLAKVRLAYETRDPDNHNLEEANFFESVQKLFAQEHDPDALARGEVQFSPNVSQDKDVWTGVFHTPQRVHPGKKGVRPSDDYLRIVKYEVRINVKPQEESVIDYHTDRWGDLGAAHLILFVAPQPRQVNHGNYKLVRLRYNHRELDLFKDDLEKLRSDRAAYVGPPVDGASKGLILAELAS